MTEWKPMWTVVSNRRRATWGAYYERSHADAQAVKLKHEHPNEDWFVCELKPVGEVREPVADFRVFDVVMPPR